MVTEKIRIVSCPEELEEGMEEIRREYPERFDEAAGARAVRLEKRAEEGHGFSLSAGAGETVVTYARACDAFRALGILMGGEFPPGGGSYAETPFLETVGFMIDCSRNGVSTVDTVRSLLRKAALMGVNMAMLYTEDTYVVEGEPFFGYLRGAYTQEELKEIDRCARALGMEMIPCIQTLAHLEQVLQWPAYHAYRDTERVLLAEEEETYALIEKMIGAVSSAFSSRRIHIGMDEAHGLGQGRYKALKGEKRPFDIMNAHLKRVSAICARHGLEPIIWSDMYFRLGSATHDYYDPEWSIPEDVVEDIPPEVRLVYWDYYHTDESFYRDWIEKHRALGSEPMVASGAWTWNHFWAALPFAEATVTPCMKACRAAGVKEAFLTAWGDDGMECDIYSFLPALQIFAEYAYGEEVTRESLARRFAGSCDADYGAWFEASRIDHPPALARPERSKANPSKYLLYDDPFLGAWSIHVDGDETAGHYAALADRLTQAAERGAADARLLFPARIARVLSRKATLRRKLAAAYRAGDRRRLASLRAEVSELRTDVDLLWRTHRDMWLATYKPFGLEVIEMRYGALRTRLESLDERIGAFIEGKIGNIPELEAEPLKIYDLPPGEIPFIGSHRRIVSPSCIV